MKIIKSKQIKYWADDTQIITNQTILNEYNFKGYKVEVIKEIGFFNSEPNKKILYKTYIKVYKNNIKIKRRLFYGDKKINWKEYVGNVI
jgi:hypothetical protein